MIGEGENVTYQHVFEFYSTLSLKLDSIFFFFPQCFLPFQKQVVNIYFVASTYTILTKSKCLSLRA